MFIRVLETLLCAACLAPLAGAGAPHARSTGASAANDSSFVQERANFHLMIRGALRANIVSAAAAMPADKFGFAPTAGEFTGVRTFSHQVKHLAATNYILAAAALGQDPPAGSGDEEGPDSAVTKPQIIAYLQGSFDALDRAVDAIGNPNIAVHTSPISPFQGKSATRISLITEAMVHSYDHYGQMVEYLRMNGVIPPASRR